MTTTRASKTVAEPLAITFSLLPLGLIDVPIERREPDAAWVHVIGKSMAEVGQLQPIRVTQRPDGRFGLVFGLARLRAAQELGWASLDASVVSAEALNEQHKRLAHIFENLIRRDLPALDRALALAEMKRIHEALYPETKNGGDPKKKQWLKGQFAKMPIWRFSEEAAEKAGMSERAIQRAVAIANGLSPASIDRLHGSAFDDDQAGLCLLAQQTHGLQAAVLDIVLAERPRTDSIADALVMAQGGRLQTAAEKAFRAINDRLARLDRTGRSAIYDRFEVEIREHAKARGWF